MSLAINRVQNMQYHPINPNFTANQNTESDITGKKSEKNDSNAIKNTLTCLGAIGLAAISAGVAFKRGKLQGVQKGAEETLKRFNNIKHIDVNTFKRLGKFEKGKAVLNGRNFNGVIHTPKAKMTYQNGELIQTDLANGAVKKYTRTNGKIQQVNIKTPEYSGYLIKHSDGSIESSKELGEINGKNTWIKTNVTPDKKVSKVKIEQYNISNPNFRNGETQALRRTTDLKTGKVKVEHRVPQSSKPVRYNEHIMVDGKKVTANFENGEFRYASHSTFNPKTGVRTEQVYEMKDGKLTPTNQFSQIDKKTDASVFYEIDEKGNKKLLEFTDFKNGNANNNVINFSRQTTNVDEIKSRIAEMGLQFDI